MKVERLDHLNLTVADIARTCDFYTRVLGMEAVGWGEGRAALRFGQQKINLDSAEMMPVPDGRKRMPVHICLITQSPLPEIVAHLERHGVPIAMGPGPRAGATGTIQSVYIKDPDDNSVEISTY
jgi:catechol 2,3-dioxygenase-like lactoylglutathione lyase family enzyme